MRILPRYTPLHQRIIDRAQMGRDSGPTAAELDAIDREMPLITAEVELLDVQITLMDQPINPLDARRLRRARRKVLAARRQVANHSTAVRGDAA